MFSLQFNSETCEESGMKLPQRARTHHFCKRSLAESGHRLSAEWAADAIGLNPDEPAFGNLDPGS
jgi:hypothetical protein